MALESGNYITDLVITNPVGGDSKNQGDDHLRLLKTCVKQSFPSVSGAVTMTHTELNTVTSRGLKAGETWTGTHDWTGAVVNVLTQTAGDSSTKAASTAFVATTAFASALPGQSGADGKFVKSNGTTASWEQATGHDLYLFNSVW